MTSKDVIEAFKNESPVRYGDIVFNRIISIRYTRVLATWRLENNENADTSGIKKYLKIIQAVCVDNSGSEYYINPLHLVPAEQSEVTVKVDRSGKILENRMKLIEIYEKERKSNVAENKQEFIEWLFENHLIEPKKAFDLVRAYELETLE